MKSVARTSDIEAAIDRIYGANTLSDISLDGSIDELADSHATK
jgi:hypothetical protein